MTKIKMNISELEKMYDERDDLEYALSLLRKASACISDELESVRSDIAWIIGSLEEEVSLLDDSINSTHADRRF